MLDSEQIARYHRDGYVVPDFRVPEETLAAIRARHAALLEREPQFHDYCPMLLDYDLGFLDYCDNAPILDMVSQLIGSDIALWNTSFFAKPAFSGKRTRARTPPPIPVSRTCRTDSTHARIEDMLRAIRVGTPLNEELALLPAKTASGICL